jgi:hypothetical protein
MTGGMRGVGFGVWGVGFTVPVVGVSLLGKVEII